MQVGEGVYDSCCGLGRVGVENEGAGVIVGIEFDAPAAHVEP